MSLPCFSRFPRLMILAAVVLVFGLGVSVGRKSHSVSPHGENTRGSVILGQAVSSVSNSASSGGQRMEENLSAPIPNLSGLTPLEARKILDGINDPEIRKAAIRQCLALLPREQWNDWIQASMANEDRNLRKADLSGMARRYTLLNELLGSAAAVDPVGFMAVQNSTGELNNDGESETRLFVMMQWAEHDPAAAKAFLSAQLAEKNPAPGMSDSVRYMADVLIRGGEDIINWATTLPPEAAAEVTSAAISALAAENPQEAAALLMKHEQKWPAMDTSNNRRWNAGNLAEGIARSWAKSDPGAALVWAAEQTGVVRGKAMNGALQDIAAKNFEAALEVVSKLPADAGAEGLRVITERAPAERLGELAALVEQTPEGAARAAASASVMAGWTDKNPEEASAWMARQPVGEVRDSAISAFVRWADVRDPEAALLWAGSMSDSAKRMDAIEHIIGQLNDKAPAAVQPWLESNITLTETERSRILEKINQPR